ncbi:uncharacterized protein ACLA_030910 [Aspergillus clavatus NRRL 1]|uniref:BED-type domain-containing protein n=1 Tax=Aspergillus clavatus (strain ATCC 1007 / CBS 513.65 / DSM 816 / NCTC 3887 / NRRL 1 / QM 1276 / 107) TaxID=344612 RepID=A1CRT7_ASPCL|nr:uncharacterized protein ACLA_030910 [Aspergillus clavatus NRRL 1]EAW08358.1 conserved hypothetical protein [Aspergillus clavatus NRRL 1]
MAPVAQSDLEMNTHTSDMASQASSLRRQFSEPLSAHSASTQTSQSPSSSTLKSKCYWCGEYFSSSKTTNNGSTPLKEHIVAAHPHIAQRYSLYDGAVDENLANGGLQVSQAPSEEAAASGVDEIETGEAEEAGTVKTYEGAADGETDVASDIALTNTSLGPARGQTSIIEQRVHNLWNIHDVHKFSPTYEDTLAEVEDVWDAAFRNPKRGTKRDASDLPIRPGPYKKNTGNKGDFLEVNHLENLLSQLRDPEYRHVDELYAITANVNLALKTWQEEYFAIDKLYKLATRQQGKPSADPRKLEEIAVFESQKEAMLYGYKYDPKAPGGIQDPFEQGGFTPTTSQALKIRAKGDPNPDGWPIIHKFGAAYVPMLPKPPAQSTVAKNTRRRKAAEMEAASQANETDEVNIGTPTPAENRDDSLPPAKRRTRHRRTAPDADQTQDNTPAPSAPASPAPVSVAARGSGRARGRGRGRGAARAPSRAVSETPQPTANATPAPVRGRGRDAKVVASAATQPVPLQARPPSISSGTLSQLAPIEPAPSGGSAAVSPATTLTGDADINMPLDPSELARREKIANAKNPRRTEAMLNHWARFNREGRIRRPKRSKSQVAADRAAEAAKKAIEPRKIGMKGPGSQTPVPGGSGVDMGIAPAPMVPPVPLPLPSGPPGLAPMPTARGSLTSPYAPIDPRAVSSFPPGPPGPFQQPSAPVPYRTPYPDYYIPYGAAAAGMPPPGPTRPA